MEKKQALERWQYQQRINLPLSVKIRLSQLRIKQWYEAYGGLVYVSFSGGKDSTVLLHLVRQIYPEVPALFIDSGVEYPEVRAFVKGFENVEWVRPRINFQQVVRRWGWPLVSKRVAGAINRCYKKKGFNNKHTRKKFLAPKRVRTRLPKYAVPFKWRWLLKAPFRVSDYCCDELKKKPAACYAKTTGRKVILGLLASESMDRRLQYMQYGCNVFNTRIPYSSPMAFWKEQDVLHYIADKRLALSSVYGEVVSQADGALTTSGLKRTGCMFCGFGVHLEKAPNRFQSMKTTHPAHWRYCIERLGMGAILSALNVPFE